MSTLPAPSDRQSSSRHVLQLVQPSHSLAAASLEADPYQHSSPYPNDPPLSDTANPSLPPPIHAMPGLPLGAPAPTYTITLPRSPARPHLAAAKENLPSPVRSSNAPPFPRPDSPLPALPPSTSQRIRAPAKVPTASTSYPAPLTSHTSLAAFKAAHKPVTSRHGKAPSQGGSSSEDTHRTSSDVDLDFSVEYDPRRDVELSVIEDEQLVEEALASQDTLVLPKHGQGPSSADWVGIDMRPAEHDIPESHLVRSNSGQLVGARHGRATSAMDLRAQFKAAEAAAAAAAPRAEVSIPVEADDGEEDERRRAVREGKRPVEGERAASTTLWIHDDALVAAQAAPQPPKAIYRRSLGRGFAYNATDAVGVLPRSAPPEYQATFASQQQQQPNLLPLSNDHVEQAKRSKAFPLPLRLLERTKHAATAIVSPALSAASSFGRASPLPGGGTVADSDAGSIGPSPLFDNEEFEGTVRTAPSTPNDTPRLQECFDEDDMAPPVPVPHRLGTSTGAAPLAGLGFSFDGAEGGEDFPTIPLRQSRRVSLQPNAIRRRSLLRQDPLPSFAVSPPQPDRPSEDGSTESSAPSQDSAADPTVSPSRRLSRRYSSSAAAVAATAAPRQVSVHFDSLVTSETPERYTGPSVRTPQHLLVTPTPPADGKTRNLSRSFSFSPAPLRLVKAQLLRAAGYDVNPAPIAGAQVEQKEKEEHPVRLDSPAASIDGRVGQEVGVRRRMAMWDDLADLLTTSPATWLDEVVPAKLAFIAGFLLGPWLWILGGWYLRPLDGELVASRGQRCRDPSCGCGRILRGSALREHSSESSALTREKAKALNPEEPEMWAGLDRWVFMNRVAAGAAGVGVAVLFAVAVWAAASA
ncbi:hypothetical protein JCM8097_003372 [Rhodosporidiobolus ruineniae]